MTGSPGFEKLVERTRSAIKEISGAELSAKLADSGFYLIDVREDREWQIGHIPGAIHVGKGVLEYAIEKTVADPKTEIVLYCRGGKRSILAAKSLQEMGYTNVKSLHGGARDWVTAKFPWEGELLE